MTELKENPFANRILEVFSEDASGHVTFNNFVDMFNVFSEHAPRDLKAYYAFKIYDMEMSSFFAQKLILKISISGFIFTYEQFPQESRLIDQVQLKLEFQNVP